MAVGIAIRRKNVASEQASGVNPSFTVDRQEIAKVAYGLFERRGGLHGQDQQDWFEAERIVRQRQRERSTR